MTALERLALAGTTVTTQCEYAGLYWVEALGSHLDAAVDVRTFRTARSAARWVRTVEADCGRARLLRSAEVERRYGRPLAVEPRTGWDMLDPGEYDYP